jgi:FkbM family methyltransferase
MVRRFGRHPEDITRQFPAVTMTEHGIFRLLPEFVMRSIPTLLARGLRRCLGPAVPPRLRLAFNYQLAQLDGCEPELALLHQLGPNRGTAIDAGANEGLFTYRLSTLYNRVHAFEINPTLADRLRRLVPSKVSVYPVGLSSREGSGTLYTPYYRGRPLHGWAGLEPWNCPTAERYTESVVSVRRLDSFGFDDVAFLKVDVEGHELELLTGAQQTIRRNRPVVLIEVKDRNRAAVGDYFRDLRYAERRLEDLTGVSGSTENYVYLPDPT